MSAYKSFYIKPSAGEIIETLLQLEPDKHSILCCTVKGKDGKPVSGALALLLSGTQNHEQLTLLQQSFTDDSGQFVFGPLEPDTLYQIKVFKNSIKLRELEISTE